MYLLYIIQVTNSKLVNAVAMVVQPPGEFAEKAQTFVAVVLCPEGFVPPETSTTDKTKAQAETPGSGGLVKAMSPFGGNAPVRRPSADDSQTGTKWHDVYGSASGRVYGVLSLRVESVVMISTRRKKGVEVDTLLAGADKKSSAVISVVEYLVGSEKEGLEPMNITKELKISDLDYVQAYKE